MLQWFSVTPHPQQQTIQPVWFNDGPAAVLTVLTYTQPQTGVSRGVNPQSGGLDTIKRMLLLLTLLPATAASTKGVTRAALNMPPATFSSCCRLAGFFSASSAAARQGLLLCAAAASSAKARAYASCVACCRHTSDTQRTNCTSTNRISVQCVGRLRCQHKCRQAPPSHACCHPKHSNVL